MKKRITETLLGLLAFVCCLPMMAQQHPEWQSQYAIGLNKLAPHSYVWPYKNAGDVRNGNYEDSPYYMSLNGKWKFHWVKNPDNRPKDFYKPSFYDGSWAEINVPGNDKAMERPFTSTKLMSLMTKCSILRRILHWCLMKKMKSALTVAHSAFRQAGKTAVW